jgi:hypothetical protein
MCHSANIAAEFWRFASIKGAAIFMPNVWFEAGGAGIPSYVKRE